MAKSDNTEAGGAKPKKVGFMIKALGAVVLLAAGGGGAVAMMQGGLIPVEAEVDKTPRLIRKGDVDPYAAIGGEEEVDAEAYGSGGSEYRTAYFVFRDDFTSNLKDSGALVQLNLAASTQRDGRVLFWLRQHELAVRSALLSVLADTTEDQVTTMKGKAALRKRLADAINEELTELEGFGGVDRVYFNSFIVQ